MRAADLVAGLRFRNRFKRTSGRSPTALLVADLNGDDSVRLRREFRSVLRRCAPPSAVTVRRGTSGFTVLLTDFDTPEAAYEVTGRLAAALGPIMIDGRLVTLAAALGVAVAAPGTLTLDELAHRAELAMSKAKSLGPDTRWAIWQDPPGNAELGRAA
ncbi:MAG TPA: diguanylate cyclase [Actinoplanes sp.]|nr:diguanylate cyclase [Actinoplanes sp.]